MKKTIPILIAMLLGFSTAWAQSRNYAFYSDAPSGQRLYYKFSRIDFSFSYATIVAPLTITNTNNDPWRGHIEPSGDLVIPDSVLYVDDYGLHVWLPVASIDNNAFYGCTGLTSVDIPNSVTSIGNSAFYSCSSLTSINIPNSVTNIGGAAFAICSSLTSVNIPNSVTSIGNSAFMGCASLTSVNIPNSVTSIGRGTFAACTSLTSVNIPNSVTNISTGGHDFVWGGQAGSFNNCTNLTSINIPNSVTTIGLLAFAGCTNLTSIDIPNSVTNIETYAFYRCTSLTSINIPNSVTSIGWGAFEECTSLSSATISNSLTKIDSIVFFKCTSLTSIDIPNSVTSIGWGAFANCTSLTSVNIPNSVTNIGGSDIVRGEAWGIFQGCTSLTSIDIPNSITNIGFRAFAGCTSLTSVNISNSVTNIGYQSFYGCTGLTSIDIPNSVTNIGYGAFQKCTSLTSIEIPNSVTNIEQSAFAECTSLTSIDIPNSVTSIGLCYDTYAKGVFQECTSLTSIEIPNSVTYIRRNAFYGCANLTHVIIPNSVTAIDDYAFYNCSRLDTIYALPSNAPSLGYNVFSMTPSIKKVFVPCSNNYASVWGTTGFDYENPRFSLSLASNNTDYGNATIIINISCALTAIIKAAPSVGYRFSQWSDGNTDNPRTLTILKNTTLTAIFEAHNVTVTALSNDTLMGYVTGGDSYPVNADATLQAIPNNNYRFVRWSDGVTANPRTITVSDDTSLTAFFELDNVYVTVNRNDAMMGSVSGNGNYIRNSEVTLQATPNRGYHFVGWSDGENTNPRTLIVSSDTTFTAIFEADIFTITANSTDTLMGSVNGSGNYPTNTTVTLQAVPNRGYRFVRWSDGILTNPRTLTVNGDTTLTAYFEPITITVTAISNNDMMGSVIGGGWYEAHTELTLQAIPNSSYRFVRWNDNITTNPRTLIAYSDTSFTAYFAPDENAGIDGIETLNAMIYTSNGEIVVDGAERNTVWLYDANGRLLSTKQNNYSLLRFNVPTSGTYFVKIGKHPAQKVIVIK